MKAAIAILGGLALIATTTGAAGLGDAESARIVTIGERTGPAFYSAIEGRYLFFEDPTPDMAQLP